MEIRNPQQENSLAESKSVNYWPLVMLAIGTFAVGTEGFMIAAILPKIASDLTVKIEAAGQLVAAFALAYAISSPVLTALSGNIDRRKLLIISMAAFVISNLVASAAPSYWFLMAARILLAFSAGLYVPNANALASALVPAEQRGRGLAIVNGGLTVAIALGVPLGAIIGSTFGWRMTFIGVAVLSLVALIGLVVGLPKSAGLNMSATTLKERIAVVKLSGVIPALSVTSLWAMGSYTVYTYIAPYLATVTGIKGAQVGFVLFTWGLAAATGLFVGGAASDKYGNRRVITIALPIAMLTLASFSLIAHTLHSTAALVAVLAAVVFWGAAGWAFFPSQQSRLIDLTGTKVASVILSLNASFLYFGFSIGAALGGFTLSRGSVADLGWVGGLMELAAFSLFIVSQRTRVAKPKPLECGVAKPVSV